MINVSFKLALKYHEGVFASLKGDNEVISILSILMSEVWKSVDDSKSTSDGPHECYQLRMAGVQSLNERKHLRW